MWKGIYLQVVGDVLGSQNSSSITNPVTPSYEFSLIKIRYNGFGFFSCNDHRLPLAWVVMDKLAAAFKGRGGFCLCQEGLELKAELSLGFTHWIGCGTEVLNISL